MAKFMVFVWFTSGVGATSVTPFVSANEQVFQQQSADLNHDGHRDLVLITEKKNDPKGSRRLLVLFGTPHGYTLSASSDQVVKCRTCGGIWGDPFADLQLGDNWLQLRDYGGSNWKWGTTFRFVWRDGQWQLSQYQVYEDNPEVHDKTTTIPPSECQNPRLNQFLCGIGVSSDALENYQVKTERAFFYDAPDYKKRLSTYVVKDDRIKALVAYKHFIYGVFREKDSDKFREGYFQLKDLVLINN